MKSLSVVISAFNEEKKIEECLKSVSFADEIIVCNNSSTDKTESIAKKYTSKIFKRENFKMLNINKNFGFSKASSDWILCLDADERVSIELKEEIKEKVLEGKEDSLPDGYRIPRKNIIFGKWIEHTGWYPDYQLRLFRKGKGKFPEKHVHEMIAVSGKTEYLKSNLIHYNYETLNQFFNKLINIYVPNEADELVKKGYVFNYIDALRFPFKEFLSRFFAREGYKDGLHGLVLSILMAFYHFIIFVNLWEKEGFKEIDDKNLLKTAENELANERKEIKFWIRNEKLKSIKNPLGKFLSKIQNI